MRRTFFNRISTVVLWLCTLISLFLALWFYSVYFTQTSDAETREISALLYWLLILFIITVCTGLIFSCFHFIRQWKENPRKIGRSITIIFIYGLLLFVTWLLGSGKQLPLIGYKGGENTYFWLKITDMWLYTLYVLLALSLLALFGGIIWSYFKKVD